MTFLRRYTGSAYLIFSSLVEHIFTQALRKRSMWIPIFYFSSGQITAKKKKGNKERVLDFFFTRGAYTHMKTQRDRWWIRNWVCTIGNIAELFILDVEKKE